jgi:hypothetical protein
MVIGVVNCQIHACVDSSTAGRMLQPEQARISCIISIIMLYIYYIKITITELEYATQQFNGALL